MQIFQASVILLMFQAPKIFSVLSDEQWERKRKKIKEGRRQRELQTDRQAQEPGRKQGSCRW